METRCRRRNCRRSGRRPASPPAVGITRRSPGPCVPSRETRHRPACREVATSAADLSTKLAYSDRKTNGRAGACCPGIVDNCGIGGFKGRGSWPQNLASTSLAPLHCESKKQDTTLLPITFSNVNRLHNSFTDRLACKFATNSYLNIPPHLKYVATLPCEI